MGGKGLAKGPGRGATGKRKTPPPSANSSPTKQHKQRGEPESQSTEQENSDGEMLKLIIAKLIKMRDAQKQDRVTLEFLQSKTESLEAQLTDVLGAIDVDLRPDAIRECATIGAVQMSVWNRTSTIDEVHDGVNAIRESLGHPEDGPPPVLTINRQILPPDLASPGPSGRGFQSPVSNSLPAELGDSKKSWQVTLQTLVNICDRNCDFANPCKHMCDFANPCK